jgi:polyisoprenoid-binding protein YceI
MKSTRLLLNAAAALFLASALRAEPIVYQAVPRGSFMKINGTSTIHDWEVESQVIGGTMELDSNFPLDPSQEPPKDLKVTPKVNVVIPVRQIKSGKSLMDTVMHNAMNAETNTTIKYTLLEMTPKGKVDNGLKFATKGTITCNGVTRTNDFDVLMQKVEANKIKVSGVTKMKMTDFKIDPPAPKIALGAIKTSDDVQLTFEWLTQQKARAAASTQ